MSEQTPLPANADDEPTGHYGPGYGEKNAPEGHAVPTATPSTAADDITAKPPVDAPEADAPQSEKTALAFERA